jgi:hypothetical protein
MALISNEFVQAPAFIGVVATPHPYVTDETPADFEARENLLGEAFGAARFEKTVERLREGRLPAPGLALVAKDAAALIGVCGRPEPAMCLLFYSGPSRSPRPIARAGLAAA